PPGSLDWSPHPFMVVAFFTNGTGGAAVDADVELGVSTAPGLSVVSPNPQHVAGVQPGQTVGLTWMVQASAPGDAHYTVRARESASGTLIAEQPAETVVPELLVPPVTNTINSGPIHLQADG